MFQAFARSLAQFDDPRVRAVVWKSLAGALLSFAILAILFWYLGGWVASGLAHWVDWVAHAGTILLTLVLVWFLFPVAVTAVASFFLDEVAEAVEERYYPGRPAPRSQSLAAQLLGTLRFAAVALFLNLVLVPIYLILLVFPPLYLVVFYAVNGYLLGREYFELVAYRRLDERTADAMRRAYRGRLTLAGMVIAVMLTIPVFNLVAPIAATAFALHLFEAMRQERPRGGSRVAG
ncbi:MAG TPA: EI24 domain-containing protein [Verrucomicrobiae bacterium]|jgi:CysZ protein|nr:EI24 domain-containing protein [Verrucomicrobiae bacterium]